MAPLQQVSDWFRSAAETEAATPITVGAAVLGASEEPRSRNPASWLGVAKLVELRRRQCRLSPEELASRAAVALEDVVAIERGEERVTEAGAVSRIARVLNLPERRVLELAGRVEGADRRVREASVRFAARTEPIEELRPEELAALEEYVKVLTEA